MFLHFFLSTNLGCETLFMKTGLWASSNVSHHEQNVHSLSVTLQTFAGTLPRHTEVTVAAHVHQWHINLVCFGSYLFVSIQLNTESIMCIYRSTCCVLHSYFILTFVRVELYCELNLMMLWITVSEHSGKINCCPRIKWTRTELTELSPSLTFSHLCVRTVKGVRHSHTLSVCA